MAGENKFSMEQLESFLNLYLHDKLPALPETWKSFLVKFTPWINLFFIVLTIPILLALLGLGALLGATGFRGLAPAFAGTIVFYIFTFVPLFFHVIAIPGLFKRTASGWKYSFYAVLAQAIGFVIGTDFSLLFGTAISLYILFQIRSYYSGLAPIVAVPVIPTAPPTTPPATPAA